MHVLKRSYTITPHNRFKLVILKLKFYGWILKNIYCSTGQVQCTVQFVRTVQHIGQGDRKSNIQNEKLVNDRYRKANKGTD